MIGSKKVDSEQFKHYLSLIFNVKIFAISTAISTGLLFSLDLDALA